MPGQVIRSSGAQRDYRHQLAILTVLAKNDDGPHLDHFRCLKS
ncbi:hypothetical protein PSN_5415 [Pseudomonas sp. NGC7]